MPRPIYLTGLVDQQNVAVRRADLRLHVIVVKDTSCSRKTRSSLTMISPRGIRLQRIFDRWRESRSLDGILPADLNNTVSGAWTIEEIVNGGGFNRYGFTVPQTSEFFELCGPFLSYSHLNDGSTVGKVFDLIYTHPLPNSFGYHIIYDDPPLQGSFPDRQINSPGNVTLSFADSPGISGTKVTRFSFHNQVSNLHVLTP